MVLERLSPLQGSCYVTITLFKSSLNGSAWVNALAIDLLDLDVENPLVNGCCFKPLSVLVKIIAHLSLFFFYYVFTFVGSRPHVIQFHGIPL